MKNWMYSLKAAVVCFAIVVAQGCGQQAQGLPKFEGIEGPTFKIVDGKVLVEIKFLNLNVDGGISMVLPETRESTLGLVPNVVDGGMLLTLQLGVADLQGVDVGVGEGHTLPDGRPIPGIPGGELENSLRIDTRIDKYDVSIYYSPSLFGFWMPFGFDTYQISAYYNVWINNKNVGMLSLVGNQEAGQKKAGALLFLRYKALQDKQLKKLIELSERNPHLVY